LKAPLVRSLKLKLQLIIWPQVSVKTSKRSLKLAESLKMPLVNSLRHRAH
jgi:hypothetical protein